MTKITIISGFLGAGKTTFIKKLIQEVFKGEQLVLIENEFGEIGIDGGFLKEAGIEITEMNSGCICCSLVGDFSTALQEVMSTYHPDRILIEPSGVGKLSDVIKAVKDIPNADLEITGSITVVDAIKAKMYHRNFGEFFDNQIQEAQTIVLSRTSDLNDKKLDDCVHILRDLNENASIITTPWEQLDGKAVEAALATKDAFAQEALAEAVCPTCGHIHEHEHHHHNHDEHCDCHEHHHEHDEHCDCGCHGHHDHDHHGHHHADEVFTSLGMETAHKYTKDQLAQALKALADSEDYGVILRAKGIVPSVDGVWYHFDLTPGEYEIREGAADFTGRLCVIGTDLKESKIKELLAV